MLLIDFSQIAVPSILTFKDDIIKGGMEDKKNIARHAILSSLRFYKMKFSYYYGEVVLCCDGKTNWRNEIFPEYKQQRKKIKKDDKLDWDELYVLIDEIKSDLTENFPYRLISVDRAEADDIVAVMALKYWNQNHMIISSDKDFYQLLAYQHINQFSPVKESVIEKTPEELFEEKITHILKGDRADGIPNILSPNDTFVTENPKRQKSITKDFIKKFMTHGRDACEHPEETDRWDRNETMIDFNFIPQDIQDNIINTYMKTKIKGNLKTINDYLINNNMSLLIERGGAEDFI